MPLPMCHSREWRHICVRHSIHVKDFDEAVQQPSNAVGASNGQIRRQLYTTPPYNGLDYGPEREPIINFGTRPKGPKLKADDKAKSLEPTPAPPPG